MEATTIDGTAETVASRRTALAAFDAARGRFELAFGSVPDEALGYRPEGDDYALGGLVVHVTEVLEHYGHILGLIKAAELGEVRVGNGAEAAEAHHPGTAMDGFEDHQRGAVSDALRSAHDSLAVSIRSLPEADYARKATVTPSDGEPYEAGAADILDWMTEHYRDHTDQVGGLLAAWEGTTQRS
jgi:hypothetical protein